MDDDTTIYNNHRTPSLNQSAAASEKHPTLMQFNRHQNDSYTSHVKFSNNNNNNNNINISSGDNENNIFLTSKNNLSTNTTTHSPRTIIHNNNNNNKGSNDHLTGSTSPSHLSSNSSVSSQAQNDDLGDCDLVTNNNNNHRVEESSPPSPQSSSYNSSYGSNSGQKLINSSNNSIAALVPGGVVTTQNISTVIKPKGNNNSLQFVKIQTPELSKKAVEQIKMAESSKICKEKIKEVEEEWQNNLLNWKSKRRQQFNFNVEHEPNNPLETSDSSGGRKIKTFAEMIEQRAKSGNRLGFHLQRYIGADNDEEVPVSTIEDTKACVDEPDKVESRTDSDCEAHSSVSPPLTHDYNLTKTTLEPVSSKNEAKTTNIVSAKSDESENSGFDDNEEDGEEEEEEEEEDGDEDEEGEEEEEQKHLQRIAFEAKLKAFERLTKPTPPPAPKFIPNRVTRKPIPTTPQSISPKVDAAPREQQLHKQQVQQQQQQQQQPPQPQVQRQQQKPQPKPQLPSPIRVNETSRPKPVETIHIETKGRQQKQPISSETASPVRPVVKDDRLHSTPNKSTTTPVSSIQIERSISQKSIDNSIQRVQDSFKQVNIVQKPVPVTIPVPHPPPEPISKTDLTLQHNSSFTNNQVTNMVQKPRNIVNQPLPESPKSVSSHRKQPREEKDKTILSVSGKKRCSSCKEELGRGAAAFVVESLSLVYHTNCFRCSVCHVNLSNGFRGVDVRVHQGSLHCQNCYSKDGLNYSRV